MSRPLARRALVALPLSLTVGAVLALNPATGASPGTVTAGPPPSAEATPEPFTHAAGHLESEDTRGSVQPWVSQLRAAERFGATVRWNRYGTPASILPRAGLLGPRTSADPVKTARAWLLKHRAAFGLSAAEVGALTLVNPQHLQRTKSHAVLFRQSYGEHIAAIDGMVTVGVSPRGVEYVSSSLSRVTTAPAAAEIDATDAWLKAASDLEFDVAGADLGAVTNRAGWTRFRVSGFPQEQQVRLRALAMPGGQVRPVYESNVVRVAGAEALGFTSYVDAVTGEVLVRQNRGEEFIPDLDRPAAPTSAAGLSSAPIAPMAMEPTASEFSGAITASQCGPEHPFEVPDGTFSIVAGAHALVASNDIIINIKRNGATVASQDTGTSPEVAVFNPGGEVPDGMYTVQVCPFQNPTAPFVEPGDYVGIVATSDQETPAAGLPEASWTVFAANPKLEFGQGVPGRKETMCWVSRIPGRNCKSSTTGYLSNPASPSQWDVDPNTGAPTFTTTGNNAETREAWLSPLTPGGFNQRPISLQRDYRFPFRDIWNNSKCDPAVLVPGGNDIDFVTTNLFAGHNRMHDFSYYLGFDERNYNLQRFNYGDGGMQGDPEVGNVQAGAITGGSPTYLGRDNANQITLQDGIPGITNQYLFQPIAGAFYSPCADGSLDASIFGHEYTHAITNRMVGGPDAGLSGFQASSLGESWSDLVAMEYLFTHDYDIHANNRWAVGPYATGNPDTGIRNYALNRNPLQFGDVGYDITGAEFHADGEIWNAVMWEVRQALVEKWNRKFPYSDMGNQLDCVEGDRKNRREQGPIHPEACAGNIRYLALMFDSYLLQQSATDFLSARDAFIAADRMRFGGRNAKALWDAFASVGMGKGASGTGTDDEQPIPSYASPLSNNGTLKIKALDGKRTVRGELFVGDYEARITPVADTAPKSNRDSSLRMVPGQYSMIFRARGYGMTRFTASVQAGRTTVKTLKLSPNLASFHSGARIDGTTGAGDDNASRNPTFLIDDTEASNWGVLTDGNVNTTKPVINVDLAGGAHTIRRVQVSAYLRPVQAADEGPQGPEELGSVTDDPDSGSRFTALRQFAIEVCTTSGSQDCGGTGGEGYTRIFTSSPDAFDSQIPRPVAPTLQMRSFNVPDTRATHVRLVVLDNQCTGFAGYHGEQDNDPLNATDCPTASDRGEISHTAELQVFG